MSQVIRGTICNPQCVLVLKPRSQLETCTSDIVYIYKECIRTCFSWHRIFCVATAGTICDHTFCMLSG
ncbi:unnamed protein product [Ixodes pacificus]